MLVAIDNTFVIPIPTLAKAIDFYRPEALSVQPQARNEVARRLAGAPNAWNAVAVGTGGNVGIATRAVSEQSAINIALADCAKHDRDCRLVVLGPFMVEMAQVQVQAQRPAQVQTQPQRPVQVQTQPQRPAQVPAPAQNRIGFPNRTGYPKTGRTELQKDARVSLKAQAFVWISTFYPRTFYGKPVATFREKRTVSIRVMEKRDVLCIFRKRCTFLKML